MVNYSFRSRIVVAFPVPKSKIAEQKPVQIRAECPPHALHRRARLALLGSASGCRGRLGEEKEPAQIAQHSQRTPLGRCTAWHAVAPLPRLAVARVERRVARVDLHHLRLLAERIIDDLAPIEALPVARGIASRARRDICAGHNVGSHRISAVAVDSRLGCGRGTWNTRLSRGNPGRNAPARKNQRCGDGGCSLRPHRTPS